MKLHYRRHSDSRHCAGLSLIELLIATLLLATVSAGGLAAYARATASYHSAAIEQRLLERAQYVFATLEPELQMAGYFGTAPAPSALEVATIPASAASCGVELIQRIDLPLERRDGYALPCAASGGGAVPATDVLIVRRVSARADSAQPGRAQWLDDPVEPGRSLLLWNGEVPADAPGGERRDLIVRLYYVAQRADGDSATPALRVKSLTSIAGSAALVDTEVMPGVENLQIELLPTDAVPTSVRITIRLCPDAADRRNGAMPQPLTVTRHFALRNAPPQ